MKAGVEVHSARSFTVGLLTYFYFCPRNILKALAPSLCETQEKEIFRVETNAVATTTQLCMGCMTGKGAEAFCMKCGWQEDALPESALFLPPQPLLNGQYLLGKVLGYGGFGITYLAWDTHLKLKLAVKEYLPTELATRTPGSSQVMPFSGEARNSYDYGLSKFIDEAHPLAQFKGHPNIASVHNFFYA